MGQDGKVPFWDNEAYGSRDTSTQTFLGKPTRFCSFLNTGAFMRIFAVAVPPGEDDVGGGGQIAVQYRCTTFSRPREKSQKTEGTGDGDGDDGVALCSLGTRVYCVRYTVQNFAAVLAYPITALRLAGATLAGAAYDLLYYLELQALWDSLVVEPGPKADLPERANRIFIAFDAGTVQGEGGRRATPELMACLRSELEVVARKLDAVRPHTWTKKLLPAPVVCRDVPAAAGEAAKPECGICGEVLQQPKHGRLAVAAWPRCSHLL